MQSLYKPAQFFLITFICTWIPWFIAAFLSHQKGKEKFQMLLLLIGLTAPFLVAFVMIHTSKNHELVRDFWHRLLLYKMDLGSLLILGVIPLLFFLATALSLPFGQPIEQFSLAKEFNVLKGWQLLSLILPLFLAPILEELGWRGYGVDSLRSELNLFYTSLLFALLWALWHLPLFFIKGSYHYELRSLNPIYVVNFFASILPAAILINWAYYRNSRAILIAIIFHAVLNGVSVPFKTEQFTKCLFTLLLYLAAGALVVKERLFFFRS